MTSSAPAAFSSRIVTVPREPRLDDALARDVVDVEQVARALGRRLGGRNGRAGS